MTAGTIRRPSGTGGSTVATGRGRRWRGRRSRSHPSTASATTNPRLEGHRLSVGSGVDLHVYDPPPAGGEAVVVPCCGNAAEFAPLAACGLPLVRYDVRNRGASSSVTDGHRLGFAAELDDLRVVCDALAVTRAHIVGWSYHALVATRFALDHPDRVGRLVLPAATPTHSAAAAAEGRAPSPGELAHLDQLQAEGVPERDPAAWCEAWRAVYVPLRMGRPERFAALAPVCDLPNERPAHVAVAVLSVLGDLYPYDWRAELREVRSPVLVVHGSEDPDPIEHAEEWVQVLPDGRLLVLDGVGTIPWVEDPDRFFGTVNRFLRGDPV